MRRGSVPMRVRRRQSDAKWRASVATCYETLKHVIPDCDKISKRKISKALILQETEKHINNLENVLKDVLANKARARGKVVLYQTEQGLVEANLTDVQQDLTLKQQTMYLQNYGQRKRNSIPSDIESGIINLRSTYCPLTVLPSECLLQQTDGASQNNQILAENKENIQTFGFHHPLNHDECLPGSENMPLLMTPIKTRPKRRKRTSTCVRDFEYYSPGEITPDKNSFNRYVPVTPKSDQKRTPFQLQLGDNKGYTPVKLPIDTNDIPTGFTPIKLPTHNTQETGFTPIKLPTDTMSPESPFTTICMKTLSPDSREKLDEEYAWSEHLGLTNLLCDETIDHMDIVEEDLAEKNSRTPQNIMKPNNNKTEKGKKFRSTTATVTSGTDPSHTNHCGGTIRKTDAKCRRQLEKCFSLEDEIKPGVMDNTDNSCLDFDGYYLFYQYVAGDKHPDSNVEMADKVSQMWKEMPEDTRDTFIAMAALEGSQSNSSHLSDDLKELDVKPIVKYEMPPSSLEVRDDNQVLQHQTLSKTFHFILPQNKEYMSLQEVPVSHVILPCTTQQVLVPEMSAEEQIPDVSESAVVPEISVIQDIAALPEIFTEQMKSEENILQMDQIVGQNIEVYADSGDFHMVPNNHCSDRARADDLGFISLSNENSLNEEFSHFSQQVTTEDLMEWKGQIVPIL